jgi:hypothetical protein
MPGSDQPIQDWLQSRFIEAYAHAKRRLKNCAAIAGWGTMNEPHPGFTGYTNLNNLENNMVAVGPMPSGFAAMAAASGYTMEIPVYTTDVLGIRKKGKYLLNPNGISIFQKGFSCPWKLSGVWADSENGPVLLRGDHFSLNKGRKVSFTEDFLSPFMEKFARRLAGADDKTLFFIEGVPAGIGTGEDAAQNASQENAAALRAVHGFHWYDGPTMFIKQWRPWFNINIKNRKIILGKKAVAALFREQIAEHILPGMPNLVGEFGLPFDIYKGRAFVNGDYSAHEQALDMYYNAMDELLLGACIWDYSADNTFRWGDLWNNEDFSIVTSGDGKGPLRPRAAAGWMRPYPYATAGTPLLFKWDREKKTLYYRYRPAPALEAPTIIFIPDNLWDNPAISTGPAEYKKDGQMLLVYHNGCDGDVEVRVTI